jgi:hypothetical protein
MAGNTRAFTALLSSGVPNRRTGIPFVSSQMTSPKSCRHTGADARRRACRVPSHNPSSIHTTLTGTIVAASPESPKPSAPIAVYDHAPT